MELPSYKYRSLAEIAGVFDSFARKYVRSFPRSKLDQAYSKGQACAWFAAAEILRKAVIEPVVIEPVEPVP